MRLVMLGTGPFAVPTLQGLAASPHEVVLVVTRPPVGRNAEASPMHKAAESLGLAVWSPATVNDAEAQVRLQSLGAELLVVCDYGEILRPETLATTRLGGINLHGSLLPKYRGAAPVQWAILRGESETGNSVIQMTPGLDAGPCLAQQRVAIDADETAAELETRLAKLGAEAVLTVVHELATGMAKPVRQDKGLASKAPRLKKEQGMIDWWRPAAQIKNQVRALQPWPRAFTFWLPASGQPVRLNIDRIAIVAGLAESSLPGVIVESTQRLVVAAGDGAVEILQLQPAGKRAMTAGEFLRGNRVRAGERLTTS